jgi:hypothetical protein
VLVFRNTSERGCDIRGYPAVTLVDSNEAALAFRYRRHGDQMLTGAPPVVVSLSPGAAAYSAINKNTCATGGRLVATWVEATPPGGHGARTAKLAHYPILGYCGPGHPGHVIDIAPLERSIRAVLATH